MCCASKQAVSTFLQKQTSFVFLAKVSDLISSVEKPERERARTKTHRESITATSTRIHGSESSAADHATQVVLLCQQVARLLSFCIKTTPYIHPLHTMLSLRNCDLFTRQMCRYKRVLTIKHQRFNAPAVTVQNTRNKKVSISEYRSTHQKLNSSHATN